LDQELNGHAHFIQNLRTTLDDLDGSLLHSVLKTSTITLYLFIISAVSRKQTNPLSSCYERFKKWCSTAYFMAI